MNHTFIYLYGRRINGGNVTFCVLLFSISVLLFLFNFNLLFNGKNPFSTFVLTFASKTYIALLVTECIEVTFTSNSQMAQLSRFIVVLLL